MVKTPGLVYILGGTVDTSLRSRARRNRQEEERVAGARAEAHCSVRISVSGCTIYTTPVPTGVLLRRRVKPTRETANEAYNKSAERVLASVG